MCLGEKPRHAGIAYRKAITASIITCARTALPAPAARQIKTHYGVFTTEKRITRTLTATHCIALMLNLETEATFTRDITIEGDYKSIDLLNKALARQLNTDTERFIRVKVSEKVNKTYAMPVSKFIANADVIDN